MSVNKPCAACEKVVYPLEQVKCLDRIWHRQCFKCQTCGMTLNMTNYRGYEKKPYCSAHYPQPKKFTVVADTPELQRFAQNTQLISNVKYHEAFEKGKGTKISVTDDPLTLQQKASMQTISQAAYHQKSDRRSSTDTYNRHSIDASRDGTAADRLSGNLGAARMSQTSTNSQDCRVRQEQQPVGPIHTSAPGATGQNFRALYDYSAKEDDEVTFIEGDIILDGDPITEGWMYGTVQRTGQFGMLPSNYVQPIK